MSKKIKVAHSPDSDDFLMFFPIKEGLIDTKGYQFEFKAFNTNQLNNLASTGNYEVLAVSAACLSDLANMYYVLESGSSVGRGFGPVIVAKNNITVDSIKHLAVPGLSTTAAKLCKMIVPGAKQTVVEIEPFEAVFEAIETQKVDAAVLIHEGQILYKNFGLELIEDTGAWWFEKYKLPIPLGVNVLSKQFEPEEASLISSVLSSSISYALKHKNEISDKLLSIAKSRGLTGFTQHELDKYLKRYVNEDTSQMDDDIKKALEILCPEVEIKFI